MATFSNVEDALTELALRTQFCTDKQQQLARKLGLVMPPDLPSLVVAARLKRGLAEELHSDRSSPTAAQCDYLESLKPPPVRLKLALQSDDREELEAWIRFEQLQSRERALKALKLKRGDVVEVSSGGNIRLAEVFSFKEDGKVYFKGGLGSGAWPDEITVLYRSTDISSEAVKSRRRIANEVTRLTTARTWSEAKENELSPFKTSGKFLKTDLEALRSIVDLAQDETTIQTFLERSPHILAALLPGKSTFVLPRQRLADKFIPDFLLADTDSSGVRWVLLELETPRSTVTLSRDNSFDKHARKGISQIEEWRHWLQENLSLARKPLAEGGNGLFDIRPQCEAFVIVGRRHLLRPNSKQIRRAFEEKNRIEVHTYDWLIERLERTLNYDGLRVLNPDALQRRSHSDEPA